MQTAENRIVKGASNYQKRIDECLEDGVDHQGKPIDEALEKLAKTLALNFSDHFEYQNLQAQAHASGKISADEARTIYAALGEVMNSDNGGWQPHVDLAMKTVITQVIQELLSIRIKEVKMKGS